MPMGTRAAVIGLNIAAVVLLGSPIVGAQDAQAARGSIVSSIWPASWGFDCNVPSPNTDFVAVAMGYHHQLGLKADGSVVAWGQIPHAQSGWPNYGQYDVPAPNTEFVAVAANAYYSLGLKVDGSIVQWGWNFAPIPQLNTGFVAIAAGAAPERDLPSHRLGLKADGSVVVWGRAFVDNEVPQPNADFVAIAAGQGHSLGAYPITSAARSVMYAQAKCSMAV